jgi:hypothetical protein
MKALLFLAACCGFARAGDVQLTVHWVEIPHASLTALLAEDRGDAALFKTVRGWVKTGQARMVDTAMIRAKAGERAIVESIGEVSYPTEYEPPDLPRSKEYEEKVRRRMEGWAKVFPYFPMFPGGWTGEFETRNVGETLQVDFPGGPDAAKGAWNMELVSRAKDIVISEYKGVNDDAKPFVFPGFNSLDVGGATPSSQWQLTSVVTPQTAGGQPDPSKKILVFARTDVLGD